MKSILLKKAIYPNSTFLKKQPTLICIILQSSSEEFYISS